MRCAGQSVLRLTHLSVEEGLSQSSVYGLLQDSYGFIWLTTGDGPNRYDGHDFIAYKSHLNDGQTGQLRDRNINSTIHEDADGNLWFSADEGIYCMQRRTGKFVVVRNKFSIGYVPAIAGAEGNKVWIVLPGIGIHCYSDGGAREETYALSDRWQRDMRTADPLEDALLTKEGVYVVDGNGLLFFDRKTHTDRRLLLAEGLNKVVSLRTGQLMVTGKTGIWLRDKNDTTWRELAIRASGARAMGWDQVAEDRVSGQVYIAEMYGGSVLRVDMATGEQELLSFQNSKVNQMIVDRSQNLWIGTEGAGVYRLDVKPDKFFCLRPEQAGNSGFMVKSLYRDTGDIWLGTYSYGIMRYDLSTRKLTPVPVPGLQKDSYAGVVMKDSTGDMLLTVDNKIMWADAVTGKVKQEMILSTYSHPPDSRPLIYTVLEWKKGHYLAGTNIGMHTFTHAAPDVGIRHSSFFNDSNINGWVYNLYRAHDGIIYIGKRNGYAAIRMKDDSTAETVQSGLVGQTVRHFYKSAVTPLLWIATEQGLVAYDDARRTYTVFDEATSDIPNSYVYAILPQNDSTLWISTNKGLSRVAVHYASGHRVTATFTNYTSRNGLQSNEFNTGAFYKCADGTMLFGGIAGLNWFHPEKVLPDPYTPAPAITGIYVNDTLVATDTTMYMNTLTLPYDRNTIGFTLRALEYTMPDQNTFAYKLEGLDKEFVYTANDKVRYSHLPPGTYRFLLRVCNHEGVWNERPLVLKVVILPPYWQTWWFTGLVTLLAGGGIFLLARLYTRRKVLAKTRELEQQHALNMERMRISKDVHDDIGSGLSRISLLSEIANRKLKRDIAAANDIDNISTISKELVDNMRDLIWLLNPENTALDSLVARIREYSSDHLDSVGIGVFFDIPEDIPDVAVSRDVQRNILLTIKEAINNGVKHAQATQLRITIRIENGIFAVSVADNGRGFDIDTISGRGNGLRNMRYRITSVGGNCDISSSLAGTEVRMSISISRMSGQS